MQEISLIKKFIHWFMNKTVVEKRYISSNAGFDPLVNLKVPSKMRNLVCIVQMFGKQDDKYYLLFNCERPHVDIL